jgi:hypothetical protein
MNFRTYNGLLDCLALLILQQTNLPLLLRENGETLLLNFYDSTAELNFKLDNHSKMMLVFTRLASSIC